MSWPALRWVRSLRDESSSRRVTLYELAFCTKDNGEFYDSQARLALRVGVSRRTLNRTLDELESDGLIKRRRRTDPKTGKHIPTSYSLHMPEEFCEKRQKDFDSVPAISVQRRVPIQEKTLCQPGGTESDSRINIPPSPQNPTFEELTKNWDPDWLGDLARAERRFDKLSITDRQVAISNVPTARRVLWLRKGHLSLHQYLRNRAFEEFDPTLGYDDAGRWVIIPCRSEWKSWLDELRRTQGDRAVAEACKVGRYLTIPRWPPQHSHRKSKGKPRNG